MRRAHGRLRAKRPVTSPNFFREDLRLFQGGELPWHHTSCPLPRELHVGVNRYLGLIQGGHEV